MSGESAKDERITSYNDFVLGGAASLSSMTEKTPVKLLMTLEISQMA